MSNVYVVSFHVGDITFSEVFRVLKFLIKRDVIAAVKNGAIVEKGRDETLVNVEHGFYPFLVQLHTSAKTYNYNCIGTPLKN